MGFFLSDKDATLLTARPVREPRATGRAVKVLPGCDACELRQLWPQLTTPRMEPQIGLDADILFVGPNPTFEADLDGLPFAKAQRKLFQKAIPGREYDRVSFANASKCAARHMPVKPVHLESCSVHMLDHILAHEYKCIVGFGDKVLRQFVPDFHNKSTARDLAGTFLPIRVRDKIMWYYQMIGLDMLEMFDDDRGPAWPVFKADLKNFFKKVDKLPAPVIHPLDPGVVKIVHTLEEACALRDRLRASFAWDVETYTERDEVPQPTETNSIFLTAAFSDGETNFAFSVDHPLERNAWAKPFIKETLEAADYWIAHNAGYELAWAVDRCGIEMDPAKYHDTLALARIRNNQSNLLSLADQTRIHLGINVKSLSDLDTSNLISYPLQDVLTYNGLDAHSTAILFDRISAGVIEDPNYQRLIHATAMTTQMQLYGLPADLFKSEELKQKWQAKAAAAEQAAHKVYEIRQWERETNQEWGINDDQKTADALVRFGKIKLPRTDKGQYKTDEPTLRALAGDNPLVVNLLDYREANKLVSTYILPVIEACKIHRDGQPHPTYTVNLTATGRLSSNDPNIQNFPRRFNVELREQIVAPPGHVLFAFDYGQLEARLIAMASKDKYFINSILTGSDIHADWGPIIAKLDPAFEDKMWEMAAVTYGNGATEKQMFKVMRDRIKNGFVFPSFYGSYYSAIARNLDVPLHIIEQVHKEFWKRFAGVAAWMRNQRKLYAETGGVHTLTGRTRHGILKGNEPFNTPIQGTGADVVADAMNECAAIARQERDPYMHPRIQIHDDLTFILPTDDRMEGYVDRIFQILAKRRYNWQTLPFLVEAKAGTSWANLEEVATFTGDYYG